MDKNKILSFMDLLDLDEEIINTRLKSIMERSTFTNQHLASAIQLLNYKNLINMQECSDCDNEEEFVFVAELVGEIQEENIDYVCEIVGIVLGLNKPKVISNAEHLLQQILANICFPLQGAIGAPGGDSDDENSLKTLLNFKLCDSILDAVARTGEKMSLPLLETPLENVLASNDDKLKIHFLNYTVPRIFQCVIGYNILDRIWSYLKLQNGNELDALKVLSSLSEFYLPVPDDSGNVKFESEIVHNQEFWHILLNGLKSNDPGVRKIGIYLIKRAIDSLGSLKKDINIITETNKIFHWRINEGKKLKENWNNFFILIDSLEEKQSNIVLPSLQLFGSIKGIENCWLDCAFNIGLRHDNGVVRLKCIEHRFETKLNNFVDAEILLEALNDVNLYDDGNDCNLLKSQLTEMFKDNNSFIIILNSIPKIKWSPVPLFNLSDVLSKQEINLNISPDIIIDILKVPCNNIPIRNAIKINITHFVGCIENLKWKDLINIYSQVDWDKVSQESKNENPLITKIKKLVLNSGDKDEFLKVITTSQNNIDFALLYLDSHEEDISIFMEKVNKKIYKIQETVNRQYADKSEAFYDVVYITHLFAKTKEHDKFAEIVVTTSKVYKNITQYLYSLYSSENELKIEEMNLIFKGFEIMVNTLNIEDVIENILTIYKASALFLKDNKINIEKKLFAICIVKTLTEKLEKCCKQEMLFLNMLLMLLKDMKFKEIDKADDTGRYRNAFYEKSCEIIHSYIVADLDNGTAVQNYDKANRNIKELIEFVENVVECGGYGCLKWILKIMNRILPIVLKDDYYIDKFNIPQFISRMWKEIEELKSNNQYTPCIEEFVKLITQDSIITRPMFNNTVIAYCAKIIEYGSLKSSPLFYLVDELSRKTLKEDLGHIIHIVCDILLYSPVPRKDHRITDNVAIQILQDPRYGLQKLHIESHFNFAIQYNAILTLSKIRSSEILETIASIIISIIEDHFKTKQRYHGNSQSHRTLLIGLQHLLLISLLEVKVLESDKVINWVLDLFGRLPHQASVRICLEWYIALHFYVKGTKLDGRIVEIMKSKNIPVISQFLILYWTLKHKILNHTYIKDEYDFVMDTFLSNTMGQMFNVRLNAQYLATKIYERYYLKEYDYVIELINKTFIESAKDKNYIKLEQDFFVHHFDLVANLTPSFIYYFLPRYCDIGSNEKVCKSFVKNILSEVNKRISTTNINDSFKKEWIERRKLDEDILNFDFNKTKDNRRNTENIDTTATIQKKYVPWKNMSEIEVYGSGKRRETTSGLIVVASLIDKLPNLGGMARTSEVFGVKTYVVDSLRHLQDKQFQGLSVSAERWVNIEEVRPGQPLKDYLMRMKTEGYSVVAAEQTSTSCQLQRFKFPKKTLLLLGHEKEGIPCDLLPIMDHCVEIPQQGFVRSLNVHVTAAIFIWEYSRQNIL